jgi:hypothetical protein
LAWQKSFQGIGIDSHNSQFPNDMKMGNELQVSLVQVFTQELQPIFGLKEVKMHDSTVVLDAQNILNKNHVMFGHQILPMLFQPVAVS